MKTQYYARWDHTGNIWRFSSPMFTRKKDVVAFVQTLRGRYRWQILSHKSGPWSVKETEINILCEGE